MYDYDNEEAGLNLRMMDGGDLVAVDDDDDDDGGEDVGVFSEAGFLEFIIPAAIANEMKKKGIKPKVKGGSYTKGLGTKGGKGSKGGGKSSSASYNSLYKSVANIAKAVTGNSKAIKELRAALAQRTGWQGTTLPGSPGEAQGFRPLLGATLAVAAPGAPGLAGFGPIVVAPTNIAQVSHLLIEAVEDSAAAAAAGDAVPPSSPFIVTALFLAGSNVIRSAAPAVPGSLFQATGSHYGYPLGTGRMVDVPASAPITVTGAVNPRRPAGASAFDITAALLSPRVAA